MLYSYYISSGVIYKMVKVHNFKIDVKTYFERGKNNNFPNLYGCYDCGYTGLLWRHGFYERNVITFNNLFSIFIQRYRCPNPNCKKTVSLLPSFVLPYYQYSQAVIFTCLRAISVLGMTYQKAAKLVNMSTFSYKYIYFYKYRLFNNCNNCISTLINLKFKFNTNVNNVNSDELILLWAEKIKDIKGLENFYYLHTENYSKSFLGETKINNSN